MKELLGKIKALNDRTDMNPVLYTIKKVIVLYFIYLLGTALTMLLVYLVIKLPGESIVFAFLLPQFIFYVSSIIVITIMLLYWKFIKKNPFSEIGFTKRSVGFFAGVLFAVLLFILIIGIYFLVGNVEFREAPDLLDFVGGSILFCGSIAAIGVMEEILCRGFLLHTLKRKISQPIAILVSSIVFIIPYMLYYFGLAPYYGAAGTVMLFWNTLQPISVILIIINYILISLLFSQLTIHTKNISAACGLHAAWNFILYYILYFSAVTFDINTEKLFNIEMRLDHIETSIVTTLVLAVATVSMFMYRRHKNKPRQDSATQGIQIM